MKIKTLSDKNHPAGGYLDQAIFQNWKNCLAGNELGKAQPNKFNKLELSWAKFSTRLANCEVIFLLGCLIVRSVEVDSLWDFLAMLLSFGEVIFL